MKRAILLEPEDMDLSSSCLLNADPGTSHKYAGHSFLRCKTELASPSLLGGGEGKKKEMFVMAI